jgi:hypothetical protein
MIATPHSFAGTPKLVSDHRLRVGMRQVLPGLLVVDAKTEAADTSGVASCGGPAGTLEADFDGATASASRKPGNALCMVLNRRLAHDQSSRRRPPCRQRLLDLL